MEGLKKYQYTNELDDQRLGINETWLSYFMNVARVISTKSKDPSTKVGAIAVDTTSKRILATGYNGFPAGVQERPERWERPTKYAFVAHSELNIVASAARFGINLTGSTLFVTLHPCVDCAKVIASSGIRNVVYIDTEMKPQAGRDWITLLKHSKDIFNESGIGLYACREVYEKPTPKQEAPEKHKTWKGCVDVWDDLANKRDVKIGDLIFVKHNNTLYEWNGVIWTVIGEYQRLI